MLAALPRYGWTDPPEIISRGSLPRPPAKMLQRGASGLPPTRKMEKGVCGIVEGNLE